MLSALKRHWPEYLMEAAGLGLFMLSAGLFGTLLEAEASPVRQALGDPFVRRALMGLAMGVTAVGIIYSPWGQRSGAHINPAVTLTFLRLGKIETWDALGYVVFQFLGGLAGVVVLIPLLGRALAEPPVHYVVTVPGPGGDLTAFMAETVISFLLMIAVLWSSNHPRYMRLTGLFAGLLVASFITFEAPLSGMSINPARTVASAVPAADWTAMWLYFLAPPLGMLAAAQFYVFVAGRRAVHCAKLNHHGERRCIFRCDYHHEPAAAESAPLPAPSKA